MSVAGKNKGINLCANKAGPKKKAPPAQCLLEMRSIEEIQGLPLDYSVQAKIGLALGQCETERETGPRT